MDKINFKITTTMETEDYRKFLYLATFCRNKMVIPVIAIIGFAGSLIINRDFSHFNWIAVIISWLFLFALAIGVVCFKVERKNKLRIASDHTGTFGSLNVLKFYDDKVVMENDSLKSTGELKYTQFYSVLESKDYFIFYFTVNQASLIRKKDVNCLDVFKPFLLKVFKDKYKRL